LSDKTLDSALIDRVLRLIAATNSMLSRYS
jgi:hypothetical protein